METKQYTPGQQVGHVRQDWVEIWGPDDTEGSHEILGSAIGENREANAQLWAAAPELLETCQATYSAMCAEVVANGHKVHTAGYINAQTALRTVIAKAGGAE
jgi:hypothetical protein